MGRNSSGTYTLPEPPFVPSTPISSAAVNSDFSDVADALTDSLSRSGDGGMTAALPLNIAGFFYQGDANTGISRPSADTQVITCGGSDIVEVTTTGIDVAGDIKLNGASIGLPVGLGPLPWSGTAAPLKWLLCRGQSLLRASYPALWTFASAEIALGNTLFTNGNGTTTFTIADMSGSTTFGSNNGTGRLTAANSGVDGDVLGSVGGLPNPTIVTANFPAYTPSGSIISTPVTGSNSIISSTVATASSVGGGNQLSFPAAGSTAGPLTITSTFTGAAQGGTSTPIKTQPRTVITNYIIYAGA